MSVGINVRGFNTAFNNRVLHSRTAASRVLPESGLPLGSLTTVPKVDIASIEVLSVRVRRSMDRTPRAASSRSRRRILAHTATTFDVSGGSRSFFDIQGREAGVMGENFGYKLSASTRARTIGRITTSMRRSPAPPSPELNADFNTNVARGEGSLVYYGVRPGGRPRALRRHEQDNTIGLTDIGRNQISAGIRPRAAPLHATTIGSSRSIT